MKKKVLLILLLALSIPSIFYLFFPGFFQTDDGEWMIIRFSAFYQAFRDGQFPVRFLERLNFGYGYPVPTFLYPGFMYLAVPVHVLGFNFVNTIKIILGISMVGSALFSYLWLSKVFDKRAAFVGSLFYLYTPYHLFDLYKRGSVGEVLALSAVPFILWQVERRSFFWQTIGIGFLILSHNTLGSLFLPLIFLYSLLIKKNDVKELSVSFVLGVSLSAFFIIPALFELSFTNFSKTPISNPFEYFSSFSLIGISTFIVLLFSLLKFKKRNYLFLLFFFISSLSIFLSSGLSFFIWKIIPDSFIQFPFRLLSFSILSTSFLAGYVVFSFKKNGRIVSLFLLLLLFISAVPFLKPKELFDKGDSFYATNEASTTVKDEYMPRWVKEKPFQHYKDKVEIVKGEGEIKNVVSNSKLIKFDAVLKNGGNVFVNTIYYPGWEAKVNGIKQNMDHNNKNGVMGLRLNKGENKASIVFKETPLRIFADFVSLLSLFMVLAFSFKKIWRK